MTTRIRGIGALDRLAEELAGAAGLRLGVADSPAELIAAHRLRYRHASEHGTATAVDDADGMQNDGYDHRALQICAWDDEVLVGTLRLVLPMPGKLLPAEEAFSVTVEPAGEVVDVGSPVIAAELAGERAQRVADGLIQAHVSMLLIGQDWRGAGLGSMLLREGLDRAGGLQLDVRTRTEGYYERLGASRSLGFRLTRENLGLRDVDL